MRQITLKGLEFTFDSGMSYGDNVYVLLKKMPEDTYIMISELTTDVDRFVKEVIATCEMTGLRDIEFSHENSRLRKKKSWFTLIREREEEDERRVRAKRSYAYFADEK
jgi:hypothetical protein